MQIPTARYYNVSEVSSSFSSSIVQQSGFHSRDTLVKLSIKSFMVPELFIMIPETTTVAFLEMTATEAVTLMLGGGLHVGAVLAGNKGGARISCLWGGEDSVMNYIRVKKEVRDNNRTLLQVGILHDDKLDSLGFILQPNPSPSSLSNFCSAMTESVNGRMSWASLIAGEESSSDSRDLHVNLSIKSFRVPELTIEIPGTETVAFLKRTVTEAVTAMLSGGLHVGVVLEGKQVRDENKTLLLTGILHDDKLDSLGFTLQPNPSPCQPPLHMSTYLDQAPSHASLDSPVISFGNLVEGHHTSEVNMDEFSQAFKDLEDFEDGLDWMHLTTYSDQAASDASLDPPVIRLGNLVEGGHTSKVNMAEFSLLFEEESWVSEMDIFDSAAANGVCIRGNYFEAKAAFSSNSDSVISESVNGVCIRGNYFEAKAAFSSNSDSVISESVNGRYYNVSEVSSSSSSSIVQQSASHSRDTLVKLSIKSFIVLELFIMIPETTTVAFLEMTATEAVTLMLGGGLHVGVVLAGKEVRDANRTLLQAGILHDDKLDSLGFTLQPNPSPSSLSNFCSAMTESVNGRISWASSSAGEESFSDSRDLHVKLSIKSFRVPELTIEIPETETVAFLKRTVTEAVTAMLSEGLHVGVVLEGEQVRDENKTLLLTGILHDDKLDSLGFTLQPNPSPCQPPLCDEDPSFLVYCSTPQPLTRHMSTYLDQAPSHASLDSPVISLGNLVEGHHTSEVNMDEFSQAFKFLEDFEDGLDWMHLTTYLDQAASDASLDPPVVSLGNLVEGGHTSEVNMDEYSPAFKDLEDWLDWVYSMNLTTLLDKGPPDSPQCPFVTSLGNLVEGNHTSEVNMAEFTLLFEEELRWNIFMKELESHN
ncbi:hypothetical protein GIB67_018957 [Kingdonia uniflora]|uniref:Telomere repeat-binding protein 1-6-like ubiquitin-like domain-containing protein n=1 Tax=Kingdonia uniflora TaxID=39325 RepID=A0A7J7N629_9MAGN|nr:hypothetical protein GIB67_018957 [Kingdonia uniflora]